MTLIGLSWDLQFKFVDVINCRDKWYKNWKTSLYRCVRDANESVTNALNDCLINAEQARYLRHMIFTVNGYSRTRFRKDICDILDLDYKEIIPGYIVINYRNKSYV